MQIFLRTFRGKHITFEVNKHLYVEELRKLVGARINMPYANIRLHFGGYSLRANMRLCCQGVSQNHTLELFYYHFPGGYTCEFEGSCEQMPVDVCTRTGTLHLSKMKDCTDQCILYSLKLQPYWEVRKNYELEKQSASCYKLLFKERVRGNKWLNKRTPVLAGPWLRRSVRIEGARRRKRFVPINYAKIQRKKARAANAKKRVV